MEKAGDEIGLKLRECSSTGWHALRSCWRKCDELGAFLFSLIWFSGHLNNTFQQQRLAQSGFFRGDVRISAPIFFLLCCCNRYYGLEGSYIRIHFSFFGGWNPTIRVLADSVICKSVFPGPEMVIILPLPPITEGVRKPSGVYLITALNPFWGHDPCDLITCRWPCFHIPSQRGTNVGGEFWRATNIQAVEVLKAELASWRHLEGGYDTHMGNATGSLPLFPGRL